MTTAVILLVTLVLTACGSDPTPVPTAVPITETSSAPPPSTASLAQQPERITVAPNAASATVSGLINGNDPKEYVLQALAGQTVIVFPNAGSSSIQVTISGQDNTVPEHVVNGNMVTAVVPTTQDYFLTLAAQADAVNLNYTMTILVVVATPPPGAERLTFTAGSATTRINSVLADNGSKTYVAWAEAGQSLLIDMEPAGSGVTISVRGADNAILGWVPAGVPFSAVLPTSQNYFIDLVAPTDAGAMDYVMTVTIQ